MLSVIRCLLTVLWLWTVSAAGLHSCRGSSGLLFLLGQIHCRKYLILSLKWFYEETRPFFRWDLLCRDSADSFFWPGWFILWAWWALRTTNPFLCCPSLGFLLVYLASVETNFLLWLLCWGCLLKASCCPWLLPPLDVTS